MTRSFEIKPTSSWMRGDRRHWLELLDQTAGMFRVAVHGYVQVNNHFHLLLELREPNLSRAMHWFNVSYTVWFNRRHTRVGPLFQGRYKAVLADPVGWGLEVSRYVHLNPARKPAKGHGRNGAGQYGGARRVKVPHPTLPVFQLRRAIIVVVSIEVAALDLRAMVGVSKSAQEMLAGQAPAHV